MNVFSHFKRKSPSSDEFLRDMILGLSTGTVPAGAAYKFNYFFYFNFTVLTRILKYKFWKHRACWGKVFGNGLNDFHITEKIKMRSPILYNSWVRDFTSIRMLVSLIECTIDERGTVENNNSVWRYLCYLRKLFLSHFIYITPKLLRIRIFNKKFCKITVICRILRYASKWFFIIKI